MYHFFQARCFYNLQKWAETSYSSKWLALNTDLDKCLKLSDLFRCRLPGTQHQSGLFSFELYFHLGWIHSDLFAATLRWPSQWQLGCKTADQLFLLRNGTWCILESAEVGLLTTMAGFTDRFQRVVGWISIPVWPWFGICFYLSSCTRLQACIDIGIHYRNVGSYSWTRIVSRLHTQALGACSATAGNRSSLGPVLSKSC